jgi:hypothetical protein
MKVYIICDDIDQHDLNCPCESCNSGGRSYDVSIYPFTCSCNGQDENCLHENMFDKKQEPLNRVYGSSEYNAYEKAKALCKENNHEIVS